VIIVLVAENHAILTSTLLVYRSLSMHYRSVEFTHEMSCLPRPPEILRQDSANSCQYNRSTLGSSGSGYIVASSRDPFPFLKEMSRDEEEECDSFETHFKKFMYGGVSVQRLSPNSESASGKMQKERRTLWFMLPEVGALRLGFVLKLSDGEGAVSNKNSTQCVKRDAGDSSFAWMRRRLGDCCFQGDYS